MHIVAQLCRIEERILVVILLLNYFSLMGGCVLVVLFSLFFFFFFQAEDGIRDTSVTGVQTCALPIYLALAARAVARFSPRAVKRLVGLAGTPALARLIGR